MLRHWAGCGGLLDGHGAATCRPEDWRLAPRPPRGKRRGVAGIITFFVILRPLPPSAPFFAHALVCRGQCSAFPANSLISSLCMTSHRTRTLALLLYIDMRPWAVEAQMFDSWPGGQTPARPRSGPINKFVCAAWSAGALQSRHDDPSLWATRPAADSAVRPASGRRGSLWVGARRGARRAGPVAAWPAGQTAATGHPSHGGGISLPRQIGRVSNVHDFGGPVDPQRINRASGEPRRYEWSPALEPGWAGDDHGRRLVVLQPLCVGDCRRRLSFFQCNDTNVSAERLAPPSTGAPRHTVDGHSLACRLRSLRWEAPFAWKTSISRQRARQARGSGRIAVFQGFMELASPPLWPRSPTLGVSVPAEPRRRIGFRPAGSWADEHCGLLHVYWHEDWLVDTRPVVSASAAPIPAAFV